MDALTHLVEVPAEQIETIWPKVYGLVKKGLDLTRWSPEDIRDALLAGEMQLWLVGEGERLSSVVVTEISFYPRCKACGVIVVAGAQRETWMRHLGDIERWAAEQGCGVIESYGRKGWLREKALKDWRLVSVVLQKELSRIAA